MSTKLFADFPTTDKATWLAKVEKDLKGKSLAELEWQLEENIRLAPFYTASDTEASTAFQKGNAWEIGEDIVVLDEKVANKALLHALAQGVDAPRLVLEKKCDWRVLLQEVHTEMIALHILDKAANMDSFEEYAQGRSLKGTYQSTDSNIGKQLALHSNFPKLRTLVAIHAPQEAASAVVAELIQAATELLEAGLAAGKSGKAINEALQFQLNIGKQYFVAIASIRAVKLLWANVLKAYGITDTTLPPIDVYVAPTAYDEEMYTNMIRASSIGLSAVVGGASRLTILAANALQEPASVFTARIARNVQHLLKMESYLDRVGDPAAGSYYIEALTNKLAETAWAKFQEK